MPKGFDDNEYIPRNPKSWPDWAGFKKSLEAREQTQRMLEPLKTAWTDEDKAWLLAMRIKVTP